MIDSIAGGSHSDPHALFGVEADPEHCSLVVLGVPWEPTASYGGGTSRTPRSIIEPSSQLDLEDPIFGPIYRYGIGYQLMGEVSPLNDEASRLVAAYRASGRRMSVEPIDQLCAQMRQTVRERASQLSLNGHLVGLLGGDHSSALGLIEAVHDARSAPFGILQIDAHHDLRDAYEGLRESHASVMANVLERCPRMTQLVQVGIRDYCGAERQLVRQHQDRIHVVDDLELASHWSSGSTFDELIAGIIRKLPAEVYVSFDIDGLDPSLCPGTGTPVPGGLSFYQAVLLLGGLVASGRRLIGFDLCEIAARPGTEWDLNVGARVLYKLCGAMIKSQIVR